VAVGWRLAERSREDLEGRIREERRERAAAGRETSGCSANSNSSARRDRLQRERDRLERERDELAKELDGAPGGEAASGAVAAACARGLRRGGARGARLRRLGDWGEAAAREAGQAAGAKRL